MSKLTDKAQSLASLAQQVASKQAELDTLHEQLATVAQEYQDMLARAAGPEVTAQPAASIAAPSTVVTSKQPTMEGQQ